MAEKVFFKNWVINGWTDINPGNPLKTPSLVIERENTTETVWCEAETAGILDAISREAGETDDCG